MFVSLIGALILIIIAYYFDYVSDKQNFIDSLKGGLFFLIILSVLGLFLYFFLGLSLVHCILILGGAAIPLGIVLKAITT